MKKIWRLEIFYTTAETILSVLIFVMAFVFIIYNQPIYLETQAVFAERNIHDYPEIKELALELVDGCKTLDCVFGSIENYTKNIPYKFDNVFEDFFYVKDPLNTVENGGDCQSKAILAIDLLKMLGYKELFIVFQPNHVCYGHRSLDGNLNLYNCYAQEIRYIKKVV